MIIQDIISQRNNKVFENQPESVWGASDSGDYPLLGGITTVDLFTPTISGVDTYNHVTMVRYFKGILHVMYATNNENEANPGGYLRYQKSDDIGVSWSLPQTLFDSPDDITKDYLTEDGRHNIPCGFVVVNNELYAVSETNHMNAGGVGVRTRTGVGVMARKINDNGTFGTIYWIENVNGTLTAPTSYPGYQGYSFDNSLRLLLRNAMVTDYRNVCSRYYSVPPEDPLNTRETYYSGNQLIEPHLTKLPSGQFVRYWRAITGFTDKKIIQTGENGVTWGDTYESLVPDSPSDTNIFTLKNNIIAMVGNNQTSREALFLALSSDGFVFTIDNIYNIAEKPYNAQFPGQGKGSGVAYPALEEIPNGKFVVIYSLNKEEIKCLLIDVPDLI